MCRYILNIYSTFSQYRDNTYIRDNFGHYNRDKTFSYCYIPNYTERFIRIFIAKIILTCGIILFSGYTFKIVVF